MMFRIPYAFAPAGTGIPSKPLASSCVARSDDTKVARPDPVIV
jgi:hypothetical protein